MSMLVRIFRDLSAGTLAMVENEKFLDRVGARQAPLVASIKNSASEATMRVDELVKQFVLAIERYKLTGSPALDFIEQIKWAANELIFHFRCINRYFALVDHPAAKQMLQANEEIIRDLEALLGSTLSVDNLRRLLEAEVDDYPD